MYTPSQSENSSIMTESKDSRPLTEAWTEEEIKRLRGALGEYGVFSICQENHCQINRSHLKTLLVSLLPIFPMRTHHNSQL